MPRSTHSREPTTLEKYLTEFLAIEGVSVEEASQFALAKERNRLLLAADAAGPTVARLLRRAASALAPQLDEFRRKIQATPEAPPIPRPRLMRTRRRRFDRAILLPKLRVALAEGDRLAAAARKLGVPYGTAYQWVKSEIALQAEVSPTTTDASPPPIDGSETSPQES
jgi:hypothetical protein